MGQPTREDRQDQSLDLGAAEADVQEHRPGMGSEDEADVDGQAWPTTGATGHAAGFTSDLDVEANPADVLEQQEVVEFDDEY